MKRTNLAEDYNNTDALSQQNSKFGALFTPISKSLTKDDEITMADLIVGKHFIHNYLETLDLGKIPPVDDIVAQPSPLGMTLIANYYEKQNDQHCRIYIASTMEDFQHVISQVNAWHEDNKAIIVFQPTNIKDEWKKMIFAMHKVSVYLEKKGSLIHMFIADSAPFESIKEVCMLLADEVLKNTNRVYYTQEPIFLDSEKKKPLSLQTDFCNCGTHAFRFIRIVAQEPDFLTKLKITSTIDRAPLAQQQKYALPASFAKCADSEKARNVCGLLFEGTFPALATHYAKHNKDYSYIVKFSRKYLSLISTSFVENSQEELKTIIRNYDARNFKPESPKPFLTTVRPFTQ